MIVDARHGNTTRGFRPYTNRAALAFFLDGIGVGKSETLDRFIRTDGSEDSLSTIQQRISAAKAPRSRYRTVSMPDGSIIVYRLS